MARPLLIIGAGGHARVVGSIASELGRSITGFVDDDPATWGRLIDGVEVLGPIETVVDHPDAQAVLAIGSIPVRSRLARLPVEWTPALIHPTAWAHHSAVIDVGTVLCAGVIVQPGVRIGRHVILNTRTSVDHDSKVGDLAHLAATYVSGGVSVGAGAFLGVGSHTLPGVRIGAGATVGAGALVVRDVPAGVTVIGIPARPTVSRRSADDGMRTGPDPVTIPITGARARSES